MSNNTYIQIGKEQLPSFAQLIETSDDKLAGWIGDEMRPITAGREYHGAPVFYKNTNNKTILARYIDGMDNELHAVFAY